MVVSSMAGVELAQIREAAGPKPALFRVMPNLGVEVGAGMVAVSAEPGVERLDALARVVSTLRLLWARPSSCRKACSTR